MPEIKNIDVKSSYKKELTAEQYLLLLKQKYEFQQLKDQVLHSIKQELDLFYTVYGEKLRYSVDSVNSIIVIDYARPKIIFLGEELPNNREHEIFSDNENGFDVKIVYVENSIWLKKEEIVHNITEVHYLYKSFYRHGSVAFESNIHSTGFTCLIDSIELIEISRSSSVCDGINVSLISKDL